MTTTNKPSMNPKPHWWETPGLLRTRLLWLDGEVGTAVEAEKQVVDSAAVSGDLARHLKRLVQQMGLGTGDGEAERSGEVPGFEPVKPAFTREAGSFRRQVSHHGVRDLGE